MKPSETKTIHGTDGVPFLVDVWQPTISDAFAVRGRIVCLHGIRSHAAWYARSCAKLSQAGYRVLFIERRGAGRNQVARGDAPGFRMLVQDVRQVLEQDAETTTEPTTLLGISWGAKLALATALAHPALVQRLIFVAPGFHARVRPAATVRARILLARLANPAKMFPIPLNDPELFTSQPEWQAFLRSSAEDLREATARFLVTSVLLDRYLKTRFSNNRLPTLTLLAGADEVIDNERTKQTVKLFPHGTTIEYPGLAHTLEFEHESLLYVNDILEWLERLQTP